MTIMKQISFDYSKYFDSVPCAQYLMKNNHLLNKKGQLHMKNMYFNMYNSLDFTFVKKTFKKSYFVQNILIIDPVLGKNL